MPKTKSDFVLAGIELQAKAELPIYRQLYRALREAILAGRLRSGQRLPATRELAVTFGVSRSTVLLAFDYLLSEGYIKGKVGAGTYVTEELPDKLLHVSVTSAGPRSSNGPHLLLSNRGKAIASIEFSATPTPEKIQPFQPGLPAVRDFPREIWARIVARKSREMPADLLSYGEAAGFRPLRNAIAGYLRTARAVRCEAEQVIIVNGSQQALDLTARVLLDAGDQVWVEDPGYAGSKGALLAAEAILRPVPVDEEGLDLEHGRRHAPGAKLIYVTPSHQYPLGVTMSLSRRLQLLDWAEHNQTWILEDDYDSEYRYSGRPLSSLQGLDQHERVIYLGTFSKVLFPALRLGYMVVPACLVDAFSTTKAVCDRHSGIFEQMVLTSFIEDGHFGRHIRRMRLLYDERRQTLLQAVTTKLDGLVRLGTSDAGMHTVGWLTEHIDDKEASRLAAEFDVSAPAVSNYTIEFGKPPGLILGYAGFEREESLSAVERLGAALSRLM